MRKTKHRTDLVLCNSKCVSPKNLGTKSLVRALLQGSSPQLRWPKVIQLTRRHAPRLRYQHQVLGWSVDRAGFHRLLQCHGDDGDYERKRITLAVFVDWATMGMPDTLGATVQGALQAIASTGDCRDDNEDWTIFGKIDH